MAGPSKSCCAPCVTSCYEPSFNNFILAVDDAAKRTRGILSKSDANDKVLKLFKSVTEQIEISFGSNESLHLAGKLCNVTAKFFAGTAFIAQDMRYWVKKWGEVLTKPETADVLFFERRWLPPAGFASVCMFHVSHALEMFIFLKDAGFEVGKTVASNIGSWGFFKPERALENFKDIIVVGASLAALVECSTELKKNYVKALKAKALASGEDPDGDAIYLDIVRNPEMRGDDLLLDLQIKARATKQMLYEVLTQGYSKLFPYKTVSKFLANLFKVAGIGLALSGTSWNIVPVFILLGLANILSNDSKEVDAQREAVELRKSLNTLAARVPQHRHIPESAVRYSDLIRA